MSNPKLAALLAQWEAIRRTSDLPTTPEGWAALKRDYIATLALDPLVKQHGINTNQSYLDVLEQVKDAVLRKRRCATMFGAARPWACVQELRYCDRLSGWPTWKPTYSNCASGSPSCSPTVSDGP